MPINAIVSKYFSYIGLLVWVFQWFVYLSCYIAKHNEQISVKLTEITDFALKNALIHAFLDIVFRKIVSYMQRIKITLKIQYNNIRNILMIKF